MPLQKQIDERRKDIRTDSYSMSIGEWISLYENDEIDIHPEFQRIYRWTNTQKSNLIESILLGIPIPPIFVSQRADGVWDVVDGLQRLSTIYQFVGVLKDENSDKLPPLVLQKAKYLELLEGKKWDDPSNEANSLTPEQRLLIKRSKIDVSIVLRESHEIAKYELFQRLNTGGSTLTEQEVRNCILVMANSDFYKWLRDLSKLKDFQDCIAISEKNIIEQYDMELALRFIIFSTIEKEAFSKIRDVGEFITEKMIEFAADGSFKYEEMKDRFEKTFTKINEELGSNAFRRFDEGANNFKGGFLLSPFEVIAYGIGFNYTSIKDDAKNLEKVKSIYKNATYTANSGSGVRANARLPHLIPLGREIFKS